MSRLSRILLCRKFQIICKFFHPATPTFRMYAVYCMQRCKKWEGKHGSHACAFPQLELQCQFFSRVVCSVHTIVCVDVYIGVCDSVYTHTRMRGCVFALGYARSTPGNVCSRVSTGKTTPTPARARRREEQQRGSIYLHAFVVWILI